VGCGGSDDTSDTSSSGDDATKADSATADTSSTGECEIVPEETAGPYPGDGSNGPDVLSDSGVVRSDITSSFGDMSGTAEGIPFQITVSVLDADNGCEPYAGAAVYLWHCDRDGQYSLYSEGITDQNYLRGVQEADDSGNVTFTSIFPACYSGRWPHIHFEVYRSLDEAADVANKIATSQIALPQDTCDEVYATDGYEASVSNLAQVTLDSDNVFGDDVAAQQLGTISGSLDDGLTVALAVSVSESSEPVTDNAGDGNPTGAPDN
jgi:protocatechuate 3,4-dioxygenase beta subunit